MQKINFTSNPHNDAKLLLDFFQDVRLSDPTRFFVGNELEVILKGKYYGVAAIVAVKPFPFCKLSPTFSFMNCGHHPGYQADLLRRYYTHEANFSEEPYTSLCQVVFHWQSRDMELFGHYIDEHFKRVKAANPDSKNIADEAP